MVLLYWYTPCSSKGSDGWEPSWLSLSPRGKCKKTLQKWKVVYFTIEQIMRRAYYELWNNAPTPLLGNKHGQIERYWKGKLKEIQITIWVKMKKIPFSEFSSLTVSWRSAVEDVDESLTRGGFTCGLSLNVCRWCQRTSIFFFCPFHSCWTCLSLVYIFVATFSFYSQDLVLCNF